MHMMRGISWARETDLLFNCRAEHISPSGRLDPPRQSCHAILATLHFKLRGGVPLAGCSPGLALLDSDSLLESFGVACVSQGVIQDDTCMVPGRVSRELLLAQA